MEGEKQYTPEEIGEFEKTRAESDTDLIREGAKLTYNPKISEREVTISKEQYLEIHKDFEKIAYAEGHKNLLDRIEKSEDSYKEICKVYYELFVEGLKNDSEDGMNEALFFFEVALRYYGYFGDWRGVLPEKLEKESLVLLRAWRDGKVFIDGRGLDDYMRMADGDDGSDLINRVLSFLDKNKNRRIGCATIKSAINGKEFCAYGDDNRSDGFLVTRENFEEYLGLK